MSCSVAVQTIEFDDGAGAVLRIQPLRGPRDENTYECVARNSVDEKSVTAKLSIIRGKTNKKPSHILYTHTHTHCVYSRGAFFCTLAFNRHPCFTELSVVDVTAKQGCTLPAQEAAGSCSFYSPSECSERDLATERAS